MESITLLAIVPVHTFSWHPYSLWNGTVYSSQFVDSRILVSCQQLLGVQRKKVIQLTLNMALDIGGSTIKATVLDQEGNILQDYKKEETPKHATSENILETIQTLVKGFQNYDKISIGFPGYVKKGIVFTAPNLGTDAWTGTNLNKLIHAALNKPVRIVNDADMQGLAIISGEGLARSYGNLMKTCL